jgi:hypothetical protein
VRIARSLGGHAVSALRTGSLTELLEAAAQALWKEGFAELHPAVAAIAADA